MPASRGKPMRPDARPDHARTPDRWVRSAVVCWAVVVAGIGVKALAAPHFQSCYPIFAHAARSWQAGLDLYSPDRRPAGLDCYRYSPLVTALLTPLTLVPDRLGGVLWRLLNAGVLLAGLAWCCRVGLPRRFSPTRQAVLFLLVLPLALGNLNNGQANPLVLGLVLACGAAAATGRWNAATLLITLACFLKLYPIAVALLLVAVYPRPLAGRLALALGVGALLPFVMQSPDYVARQYGGWLDYLRGDDRSVLSVERCYRDFQLLCRVWLVPLSTTAYRVLQVVVGAALAVACVAARRAGWPRGRLLGFLLGLGTCWMTVFGPATESCTYLLATPALGWALLEAGEPGAPRWARSWLAATYLVFLIAYAGCWFPGGRSLQALGLQPLAALSLLAYLLVRRGEQGRQTLGREEMTAARAA